MKSERVLIWILFAALIVRLALFLIVAQTGPQNAFVFGDGQGYVQISQNLLGGHGFSMATTSPYLPDSIRTPLIPLLLAAVTALAGTPVTYIFFEIILAVAIVYLTYRIAVLITRNERLALWAAALMAFEPYSVFINLSVLTETLFAFLVTAATYYVCLYIRDRSAIPLAVASALFGLAALTRPIAEFIPVLLILLVLIRESLRAYPKYLVAAIIPFLLVASPWLIRNHQVFGMVSFSSGGLQNVYSDLGATILSYRDGTDWRANKNALETNFAERHQIPLSTIQQNLSLSPILFREGLVIMLQNPKATIISFVSVAIAFFTNDSWIFYLQLWRWVEPFEFGFSPTHSLLTAGPLTTLQRIMEAAGPLVIVPVVGRAFWLGVTLLFGFGSYALMRKRETRVYAIIFLVTVLYYLGLSWSAGAGVNGRYRYPVNPIVFTFAATGAWYLLERIRRIMKRTI